MQEKAGKVSKREEEKEEWRSDKVKGRRREEPIHEVAHKQVVGFGHISTLNKQTSKQASKQTSSTYVF